jgi:hypothetical protein
VGVASGTTRDAAGETGSRHLESVFNHGPRHLGSSYGSEGHLRGGSFGRDTAGVLRMRAQGWSLAVDFLCVHPGISMPD